MATFSTTMNVGFDGCCHDRKVPADARCSRNIEVYRRTANNRFWQLDR